MKSETNLVGDEVQADEEFLKEVEAELEKALTNNEKLKKEIEEKNITIAEMKDAEFQSWKNGANKFLLEGDADMVVGLASRLRG